MLRRRTFKSFFTSKTAITDTDFRDFYFLPVLLGDKTPHASAMPATLAARSDLSCSSDILKSERPREFTIFKTTTRSFQNLHATLAAWSVSIYYAHRQTDRHTHTHTHTHTASCFTAAFSSLSAADVPKKGRMDAVLLRNLCRVSPPGWGRAFCFSALKASTLERT